MSEVSFQPAPIATWNSAIGVWEKKDQVNLLCAHSELFSEVWPTSGQMVMMPDGSVCALPMLVRLTADSESLSLESGATLLRSPKASEASGGALGEAEALKRGNTVGVRDQVMDLVAGQGMKVSREVVNMPTPTVNDMGRGKTLEQWDEWTSKMKSKHGNGNGHGPSLDIEMLRLLPTPNTMEHLPARTPEKIAESKLRTPGGYANLRESVVNDLTSETVEINWDKFEPAIRRWEAVMGRPAPAPTLPDGKDGAHRLSPWLTEWMMGLPEGWICSPEIGLTRNEQLKAAGNGVCPAQAELALSILLEGIVLE